MPGLRFYIRSKLCLFFCYNSVCNIENRVFQPQIGKSIFAIIGLAIHLHSSIFAERLNLSECLIVTMRIYCKGSSTLTIDQRECRNVTWAVCDIDHILKGNTTHFFRKLGVDLNAVSMANPLVNFKDSSCFCGVIDSIDYFRKLFFLRFRISGFNKITAPYSIIGEPQIICVRPVLTI